jgi:hypothetical protein
MRERTLMTFIDFRKAFDRIDREILCFKMKKFGIKDSLIGAIQSMLFKTSLNLNGEVIETFIGGPQGSVLSPALWNIYCADLGWELMRIKANNLDQFLSL